MPYTNAAAASSQPPSAFAMPNHSSASRAFSSGLTHVCTMNLVRRGSPTPAASPPAPVSTSRSASRFGGTGLGHLDAQPPAARSSARPRSRSHHPDRRVRKAVVLGSEAPTPAVACGEAHDRPRTSRRSWTRPAPRPGTPGSPTPPARPAPGRASQPRPAW